MKVIHRDSKTDKNSVLMYLKIDKNSAPKYTKNETTKIFEKKKVERYSRSRFSDDFKNLLSYFSKIIKGSMSYIVYSNFAVGSIEKFDNSYTTF